MNKIQIEDIRYFAKSFTLADELSDGKFMVTGATGLIGSTLVHCLLSLNKNIEITCPVRNLDKARTMFCDESPKIHLVECDLVDYLKNLDIKEKFQYIIHCASPTVGKYMTEHPIETYMLAIDSTHSILEYARNTEGCNVLYVSSLEYYGQNFDDRIITEDMLGYIDNTAPRSSYPLGKRAAEFLCVAYAKQYDVNVKVARLTQTFGAGVAFDDNRVFAQFARSVIAGTNIILHTKGESAKPYCYTTDCISAILYILLKGENGGSYNVANQETYISIRNMAEFVRENFNPAIRVIIDENLNMGYAPITKLNLSTEKLRALGWKPQYNLKDMFRRLIDSLK